MQIQYIQKTKKKDLEENLQNLVALYPNQVLNPSISKEGDVFIFTIQLQKPSLEGQENSVWSFTSNKIRYKHDLLFELGRLSGVAGILLGVSWQLG